MCAGSSMQPSNPGPLHISVIINYESQPNMDVIGANFNVMDTIRANS